MSLSAVNMNSLAGFTRLNDHVASSRSHLAYGISAEVCRSIGGCFASAKHSSIPCITAAADICSFERPCTICSESQLRVSQISICETLSRRLSS